jgi:thiol:disulfide interchange protein DsbC
MMLMASFGVHAAAADLAEIEKQLAKMVPGDKPDRISESPIPGLYEVAFGPEIFYMTKNGRYVLQGDIYDVKDRMDNLTEKTRSVGRRDLIAAIDESTMVVFRAPEEKYVITVFTDVDCTYCRKMHREMADYNREGITVRYLAYPRSGFNTPSHEKAVSVWCAADRNAAMTIAKSGEVPPLKTCKNPVADHMAAAAKIGLTGTPTLVLDDGTVLPGYVEPRRLVGHLAQLHGAN